MRVYNETTQSFALKCLELIKEILSQETGIKVNQSRFEIANYTFPISVEVFTGNSLGYFRREGLSIGINYKLMFTAKDKVLKDILRHELAHYLTYIENPQAQPHGEDFKATCRKYNWPDEVSHTRVDIEAANEYEGNLDSERIITKVKNLLKLAQSDNPHEAELATLKANQLLLKYNIQHLNEMDELTIYSQTVLTKKRKDSKMRCIGNILTHFMVTPIYSYSRMGLGLDVAGTHTNVEMAAYVAEFLNHELDRLWIEYKREFGLQGLRAKNSFFSGVALGYDQKMQQTKESFTAEESKALVKVTKTLEKRIYQVMSLTSTRSYATARDEVGLALGQMAGRSLTINQAVNSTRSNRYIEA